jgi:hypothetical protein
MPVSSLRYINPCTNLCNRTGTYWQAFRRPWEGGAKAELSMQTQLIQDLVGLQTRGYCTRPNVKITSMPAQQRSGHAILGLSPPGIYI